MFKRRAHHQRLNRKKNSGLASRLARVGRTPHDQKTDFTLKSTRLPSPTGNAPPRRAAECIAPLESPETGVEYELSTAGYISVFPRPPGVLIGALEALGAELVVFRHPIIDDLVARGIGCYALAMLMTHALNGELGFE